MTKRLYYTDSSLLEFDATIISCEKQADDAWHTLLDQSAFYPTSGGQLHDLGRLGDIPLTDVIESESGEIIHITGSAVGEQGQTIKGQVDAEQRMANRQLHTAQHLLSQVLFRLVEGITMSVHLGLEYGAVEIDQPNLDDQTLAQVEVMVNDLIASGTPIEIIFAEGEEIARLALRKPPKRSGRIRVIRMGEIECSACGGTHCDNTAQVQIVKIIGREQIRKRTLIKFLAGRQALADYQTRFEVTSRLSRSLTCSVVDLPDKCERLRNDNKSLKSELNATRKEQLPALIDQLAEQAEDHLVVANIDPALIELAVQVTTKLAEKIDGVALLIVGDRCFIACSTKTDIDAGALMKGLASETSIKGGGRGKMAQGGGAVPQELPQYKKLLAGLMGNA